MKDRRIRMALANGMLGQAQLYVETLSSPSSIGWGLIQMLIYIDGIKRVDEEGIAPLEDIDMEKQAIQEYVEYSKNTVVASGDVSLESLYRRIKTYIDTTLEKVLELLDKNDENQGVLKIKEIIDYIEDEMILETFL